MGEMTTIQRPDTAFPEWFGEVCKRLADGRTLRDVCRDPDMPDQTTVNDLTRSNERAALAYARARSDMADAMFEEMFDIAEDGSNDWMERRRKDGSVEEVPNHEHIARSKLRIDMRKWALAKIAPAKYAEVSRTELTGKDGGAIQTETTTRDPIVSELAALLRQAKRPGAVTIDATPIAQATKKPEAITPPAPAVDDISDLI